MRIFEGQNISDIYDTIIEDLLNAPEVGKTQELTNVMIVMKKPSLDNLHFYSRKISLKYAIAELNWYWSGNNSCKVIGEHAKKWLEISDDGMTSNSAYGYIIFHKYFKNQLEECIDLLFKDKNTRRAVIHLSDPFLNKITTKDMQCTMSIQFLLRNDELDMTVYMRSNDVVYGLPYDFIFFESIHQYLAKRLNCKVGWYIHNATSLHLYLNCKDKLKHNGDIFNLSEIANDIIKEKYEN